MTLQQLTSLLLSLAPYLVPVLAAILFPIVSAFLAKLPAPARERLAEIVRSAVDATEQVMAPNATPTQKKADAIKRIEDMLAQAKLNIPASVYDSLIEQAVLLLNMAQGKTSGATASPLASPATATEQPTVIMSKFPGAHMPPFIPDEPFSKQGAE